MAAIPFQAHANYGTWSIGFALEFDSKMKSADLNSVQSKYVIVGFIILIAS